MKKFLLSLATLALAASASATSYTIFDISNNPGEWTGGDNGWTTTVVVDGKSFTITTAKESQTCNNLPSPLAYQRYNAWRVYKGSSVSITSADMQMKQIVITYDDYTSNGTTYYGEMVLSEGWAGVLEGVTYTIVSEGLENFKATAEEKQVRIKSIVVSDEKGEIEPPVGPQLPEDVVYQNTFAENLDGMNQVNDESLSETSWYINKSIKCAVCNSYNSQTKENLPANCKLQVALDLTDRENCTMQFEQAFGFDFPTAQNENYRVYVVNSDNQTSYLNMANYPAAPASGNWSDWVENDFDLSEFDGESIVLGFEYKNDGSKSRAWEIKNFVVKGDKLGAVEGVAVENAAPVYYNLQGVRVANPTNGLFIVVKGNKSQKVVF